VSLDIETLRRQLREDERREERQIMGCAGGVALMLLALAVIVFIGCPAAVSYGISRGCAHGSELGR